MEIKSNEVIKQVWGFKIYINNCHVHDLEY